MTRSVRETGILGIDDRGLGPVALQQRQHGHGRGGRAGQLGQPFEEIAAVQLTVRIFVEKIDDFLVHSGSSLGYHAITIT